MNTPLPLPDTHTHTHTNTHTSARGTSPELHINPKLVAGLLIKHVVGVGHQAGLAHGPLVCRKEQHVRTTAVHLVGFSGVNCLLLHGLYLQGIQLLVKNL